MTGNRIHLIRTLENLELLAGRYERIRCVNYDVDSDQTRGCFSLVFKAHDRLLNKPVALKFFDVHPKNLQNRYRIAAFEREPAILQALLGQKRCLQLVAEIDSLELDVKDSAGNVVITLPCSYFVIDWLPEEIDHFFERQNEIEALEKLRLFNEIVLAVEALHKYEVHHRDLKPDNLRAYRDALKRIVVAIDLGTAARSASDSLREDYESSVGAPAYAPPEALLGFSGDRRIAYLADHYALGCLLWELFNPGIFGKAVRNSVMYDAVTGAIALQIANTPTNKDKLSTLGDALNKFTNSVPSPSVSGLGTNLPKSIFRLIDDICSELTSFDYRKRKVKLERIRMRIWSAIRCVENNTWQQILNERRRLHRTRRLELLRAKQERLHAHLNHPKTIAC